MHFDGLVQERRNSSALAMELRFSSTNPSIYNQCVTSIEFGMCSQRTIIIRYTGTWGELCIYIGVTYYTPGDYINYNTIVMWCWLHAFYAFIVYYIFRKCSCNTPSLPFCRPGQLHFISANVLCYGLSALCWHSKKMFILIQINLQYLS